MLKLAALSLLGLASPAYASEEHNFEWAGLFPTPESSYIWTAQKVSGDYADPAMKLAVLEASAGTDEAFELIEETGDTLLAGDCPEVTGGSTLTPSSNACYSLTFDANQHTTTFFIDTSGSNFTAFFAEHVPTEFENDMHYLKDLAGEDIEPAHELPEAEEAAKPWGVAIGAAITVNIVTLCGVIFVIPIFSRFAKKFPVPLTVGINSFASGALLSAAFFLMFYEATSLIKPEGSTEAHQTAWWGSAILFGFLSAYILDVMFAAIHQLTAKADNPKAAADDDMKTTTATEVVTEVDEAAPEKPTPVVADTLTQRRILVGVLLADFMHNLVDGIFIGFAFMACGTSTGWTITAATVAHEVGQEIADYLVLTNPTQGNLKPWKALALNFVSGISVLLGVIIVLAQGAEDNFSNGMLLAFGGGIYIHIGAAECMSRCAEVARTLLLRLMGIVIFIIGAIVIGVVLVSHEHCVAGGGGHDHAH